MSYVCLTGFSRIAIQACIVIWRNWFWGRQTCLLMSMCCLRRCRPLILANRTEYDEGFEANGSLSQFSSLSTLVQTLLDKSLEMRMLFPQTMKLANLLIVVPESSATAERSFSCLRRLTRGQSNLTKGRIVAPKIRARSALTELEVVFLK